MTSALRKPLCNERRKFARRLGSYYRNCIYNHLYLAKCMNSSAKPPTSKKRSERLSDLDSCGRDSSGCWFVTGVGLIWLAVIIFNNINNNK